MAKVELPKDAEGHEIPLDTETLYDEYGESHRVDNFAYFPKFANTDNEWAVEFDGVNNVRMFASQMYLIQPDSWKKLEEDLDKCFSSNNSCYYLSKSGECCDCTLAPNEVGRTCDAAIFSSIKERICKLRKKNNS
jgi:hypothetical protein